MCVPTVVADSLLFDSGGHGPGGGLPQRATPALTGSLHQWSSRVLGKTGGQMSLVCVCVCVVQLDTRREQGSD